jgi:hypothetical protein
MKFDQTPFSSNFPYFFVKYKIPVHYISTCPISNNDPPYCAVCLKSPFAWPLDVKTGLPDFPNFAARGVKTFLLHN